MRKLFAPILLMAAGLLAGPAHAVPLRYQLTGLVGYFDYDTATSTLYGYNFKIGPLSAYSFSDPIDLVNIPAFGAFAPEFSTAPDHLYFTDMDTTSDAIRQFDWHVLFHADFFQPGDPAYGGSYDGTVNYAEELDVYSLSDNSLLGGSIVGFGGDHGFFSIGPAPVPEAAVPEPRTAALVFAGLGLLGIGAWRRKAGSVSLPGLRTP